MQSIAKVNADGHLRGKGGGGPDAIVGVENGPNRKSEEQNDFHWQDERRGGDSMVSAPRRTSRRGFGRGEPGFLKFYIRWLALKNIGIHNAIEWNIPDYLGILRNISEYLGIPRSTMEYL